MGAFTGSYRVQVCRYLASSMGEDTPSDIAARMLEIQPYSMGMSDSPGIAQIHAMRAFLQAMGVAQPANDQGVARA